MVEFRMIEHAEAGAPRSALRVVAAVDEPRDARLNHGTSTHATRFNGDVEARARQAVIAQLLCRGAQCDHFGVRRGIALRDCAVAPAPDDAAIPDEDGADGHFALPRCRARLFERQTHVLDIARLHWASITRAQCGGAVEPAKAGKWEKTTPLAARESGIPQARRLERYSRDVRVGGAFRLRASLLIGRAAGYRGSQPAPIRPASD